MNDIQNANLNMFQTVNKVLDANKSKFSSIQVVNSAALELAEKIEQIRRTEKTRSERNVKVTTSEKQSAKEALISSAVIVARIANVYAFDADNKPLQAQTNVTKSQFYKSTDNNIVVLAKTILEKSVEYKDALGNYGLTAVLLDSLERSIDDFSAQIATPRNTIVDRSGDTKSLAQLFAETKSLLIDRLDKLMAQFKESESVFYDSYFAARNVVNTSPRKESGESTSTEAAGKN